MARTPEPARKVTDVACGCNKNRATASGGGGTYTVYVSGRQVYESTNKEAADTVGARFDTAEVFQPDGTSYIVKGTPAIS